MEYIFLDDIIDIVTTVQNDNPSCNCFHIDVTQKKDLLKEIENLLEDAVAKSFTIIANYDFKLYENKGYENVFDYVLKNVIKNHEAKINSIIVYSYQYKFKSYCEFRVKIKEEKKRLFDEKLDINLVSKLTSATFVRQKPLYGRKDQIDTDELKEYALYLSKFVGSIISGCEKVLSDKNLDLERWLFLTNKFLLPNNSNSSIFKLGTISFLNPEGVSEQYAFDIPYKDYYSNVNDVINSSDKKNNFLKEKDDENDFNCIYLKISPIDKVLNVQVCYPTFFNKENVLQKEESLRHFWIKILFTSVFYQKSVYSSSNKLFEDWKVNELEKLDESSKYVEIYWFYHEHHYDFLHKKGFLNFTLYRNTNAKIIKKEIKNSNKDLVIDYLKSKAEELYETNYNQIEAKVLESIVPHYTKETIRQSKRNSKLDLAAYNISHTYSSHVYPFIEKYLNEIQEHIYSLFDRRSNGNKEEKFALEKELKWFKNYYNEQLEKFTRLAINLSAANDRFNKEVDKMFYSTYVAGELFNQKLAGDYFSKFQDNSSISSENGLSLGITDGNASCLLHQDLGKMHNIAIPYGEIGVTMLMMLITNLFRNLKKHSTPDNKYNYKNNGEVLVENLNNLERIKSAEKLNYLFYVRVTEIKVDNGNELQKKFANDFLQVSFIEKSRAYNSDSNLKLDGKNLNIKELTNRLTQRFSDWSGLNEQNWKGLKEIRMIASVLIACPIEEINFVNTSSNYFEHKGQVFPKHLVSCEAIEDERTGQFEMHHRIYLKKAKFCTIWCKMENKNSLNPSKIKELLKKGIQLKVKGDTPNPLASISFVVDCDSGLFDEINDAPRKHFNFRFLKADFNLLLCSNDIEQEIKNLWLSSNSYLKNIDRCLYKSNDIDTSIFGNISKNTSVALIDDHFIYSKTLIDINDIDKAYPYIECDNTKCLNTLMTKKNPKLEYLQREAVNTKVVVYDEVLFELVEHKNDKVWSSQKVQTNLEWKGVFIEKSLSLINGEVESLKQSFDGKGKSDLQDLINDISKKHDNHCNEIYYFLLHYSGFEKLYNRTKSQVFNDHFKKNQLNFDELSPKDKFATAYKYLIDKVNCKGKSSYIVLCSGKFPNLLPDNAYFIDRQSLKYYILDISSKIQLINQLSSLRIQKYTSNEK